MKSDGSPSFPAEPDSVTKFDVVILFSGGADSILMLEMAKDFGLRPYCVVIDYQQLHYEEINVAKRYLQKDNTAFRIVKIHDLQIQSGLTGAGNKGRFEGVHEMHVPSRNLIFVGIAASIAEDMGCDTIWIGSDFDDYFNAFPDCMQPWIASINKILEINGPLPIKIEAPLLGMFKKNILKILKNRGVNEESIFSGYGDL